MKVSLLLDTKYLLFRSVTKKFNLTHNESKTGAHYLFWSTTKSIAKRFKPDNIIAMFDSSYSLRKEIFPGYKKRTKTGKDKDENLVQQLITIKEEADKLQEILRNLNVASYIRQGLEADDLFAMYINQFENKYNKFIIVTSDADIYQLLKKDKVEIYDPKKKKILTEKWLMKTFGVTPAQWVFVKAWGGCQSDKVPGIYRVSTDTAIKHITGEKESKKILEKINSPETKLYLKLVKLPFPPNRNIPLLFNQTSLDYDKFFDYCQLMGFKSFIEKIKEFEELFGG